MSNPLTIQSYELKNPILRRAWNLSVRGEVRIVTIRQPVVKDILGISGKGAADDIVEILSRCSSLSRNQIEALSVPDFVHISEILTDLMKGASR